MNYRDIPDEVRERNESYWGPWEAKVGLPVPDDAPRFDPNRLVWAAKSEMSRCDAWIKALRTNKAKQTKRINGWRKCHTENYWCYYAKITPEVEECQGCGRLATRKCQEYTGLVCGTPLCKHCVHIPHEWGGYEHRTNPA